MSTSNVTMNGGDSGSAANGKKQGEAEAKANGTGATATSSTTSTSTATATKTPQAEAASDPPSQNPKETKSSTNGNKTAGVSATERPEKSPVNTKDAQESETTPTGHDTAGNKRKDPSDAAQTHSKPIGTVRGDEDGSAVCIGEEGNAGGASAVPGNNKDVPKDGNDYQDDYQSYLTPIAYHGTYPEVDLGDVSATTNTGMGSLEHGVPPAGKETNHNHNTRRAKPTVHKGPRTATKAKIQNSHFQAASLPLRSNKELVDTYRSVSGLPRPLHFLWIKKKKKSHATVPGQFENANEQNIVGPQYDPRTLTPSQQLQRQLPQSPIARNIPMQQHFVPGTAPTYPPQFQTAPGQQPLYQRYGMPSMPPSQQLNAAMIQAQQNMQVPPAQMRQTQATTPAHQDPRLMQARMELVNAYKKVCTLEINANGAQQQQQHQQLQPRR